MNQTLRFQALIVMVYKRNSSSITSNCSDTSQVTNAIAHNYSQRDVRSKEDPFGFGAKVVFRVKREVKLVFCETERETPLHYAPVLWISTLTYPSPRLRVRETLTAGGSAVKAFNQNPKAKSSADRSPDIFSCGNVVIRAPILPLETVWI